VVDLNPGDSFGELALQQDAPRAATIIAASDSWLITFDKEAYQRIIQNVQ
jgi:cAMP-dependent protein kinase regulator